MLEHADSRDFLLSIHPVYVEQILIGQKTVELRRRFAANVGPRASLVIYCTSPTQAIVGHAVIAKVVKLPLKQLWAKHGRASCVSRQKFFEYFSGLDEGFGIVLEEVKTYHAQVPAAKLKQKFGFVPPQSFMYVPQEFSRYLQDERTTSSN
jgi:predicted transcriptional regulator